MLSVHVLQVQAGQSTPFQTFSCSKAAEAQAAGLLAMWDCSGVALTLIAAVGNQGLSMFSVGDGLV